MSAQATNKARVEALFARVQALPQDDYDDRGMVLAHLMGALQSMADDTARVTLSKVLDALERAIVDSEARAARKVAA